MPDRGIFVLEDGSGSGASAKQARRALAGLISRMTGGVVSPGVMVDDMSAVVVGKADMSYDVRPAVFVMKFSDANGPTVSASEATVNVTTTAAPGANSRIDAVYAIQRLLTADGGSGTTNVLEFGVVQGATAASPSAPAVPAGSIRLANVTVTSGVTATSGLTYTVPADLWTVSNGGLRPTAKGSRKFLVWNGTTEVPINAGIDVQGASEANKTASFTKAGVSTVALNGSGDGEIIFDAAFPSAIINAQLTDATGGLGAIIVKFTSGSSSATRITLRAYDSAGTPLASQNIAVSWTAIGR